MKTASYHRAFALVVMIAVVLGLGGGLFAQTPGGPTPREVGPAGDAGSAPPDGPPGFDGPPPFGPGGFGSGGFGGVRQDVQLVKKWDKNGDGWLNADERKAAREELAKTGGAGRGPGGRRGPFGGGGGFGRRGEQGTPKPGVKLAPADVRSFADAPVYGSNVLRTFFLDFEDADWEKELAEFKNTDVEVPARLTVDGKTFKDVGVHFHGASSFMMVGEGFKRSLVLTLDFIHKDQHFGGNSKLVLLNSHEDPSFLRTVLSLQVARDYMPAPKANFARVVINSESWGIYVNQQHFGKELLKENFGATKGARWKVPGSPGGRGGLEFLGEDPEPYKRIYDLKSKDEPKSWSALIRLCKVLDRTPPDQLEKSLSPLLDIDSALRYFAWDNALANGDGFWARASDFSLYEDERGRFHIIPYDANESFSMGGGPGGPGGPRGGGPGGFGPAPMITGQVFAQGDRNEDQKISREEFVGVADVWFRKLDTDKAGKISLEQFTARIGEALSLPGPPGGGPQGMQGPGGRRGGFGPGMMIGSPLFAATDADKDGSVTREEFTARFEKWFAEWDTQKSNGLAEEQMRTGFASSLPAPQFGGPGGGRGRGGPGFGRGFGPGGGGPKLDPLVTAGDSNKALLSKMLAVPALKERYLGYVKDIAERWLDWNNLGPIATEYHTLIAEDVKADTRKLDSFEGFESSLAASSAGEGGSSLRVFADQRRAFLLSNPEVAKAGSSVKK